MDPRVCVTISLWFVSESLFTGKKVQNEDYGQMSAWFIDSALDFILSTQCRMNMSSEGMHR